jgi:hypothetical protein
MVGPPANFDEPQAGAPAIALSTHFDFQNKVFSVAGSYFALPEGSNQPTFYVPLGEMMGVMTLPALISGFNIRPDSRDTVLLRTVEKALAFVRRIYPGDSIPRELLDGSASWAVEERHLKLAVARLAVRLVVWAEGSSSVTRDRAELLRLAAVPSMHDRMSSAVGRLTEKLRIDSRRAAEMLEGLNRLGRELSYVEALRDRLLQIQQVAIKAHQFGKFYAPDRGPADHVKRIVVLLRKPLAEYDAIFSQIDARTEDIVSLLDDADAEITFVRMTRDNLRQRFMIWDDLIARWQQTEVAATPAAEALLRDTYRFSAVRFPQGSDWGTQPTSSFSGARPSR